jgi:X-X-X-Leu-X-X-Gly heptad repeat protein
MCTETKRFSYIQAPIILKSNVNELKSNVNELKSNVNELKSNVNELKSLHLWIEITVAHVPSVFRKGLPERTSMSRAWSWSACGSQIALRWTRLAARLRHVTRDCVQRTRLSSSWGGKHVVTAWTETASSPIPWLARGPATTPSSGAW